MLKRLYYGYFGDGGISKLGLFSRTKVSEGSRSDRMAALVTP